MTRKNYRDGIMIPSSAMSLKGQNHSFGVDESISAVLHLRSS